MNQLSFLDPGYTPPPFGGVTYSLERDAARMTGALLRVWTYMRDGQWRTLADIAAACGTSEAGASARLRDCRKPAFWERFPELRGCSVERRHVENGLHEYRVVK
jgi:hypothetical protein